MAVIARHWRLVALFGGAYPLPAAASGGAHVVDDAAVERVGTCHVESWTSRTGRRGKLVNASPACTFRRLPMVEWGGAVQHDWGGGARPTTLAGGTVKWRIGTVPGGPDAALSLATAIDLRSGAVRSVYAVVPLSFAADGATRFNVNLGWARDGTARAVVVGAQIEHDIARGVTLMAETYRIPGARGVQGGIRLTPGKGHFDIDLLAAREHGRPARLTLGFTVRR